MVWKTAKNGFHGVELFPKLASMAWKNGENGFHGVEVFAPQGKTTPPQGEGAASSAPEGGGRS
ncbi:MAG: hypothetical protein J6Y19_04980 [Kiritimatiellae bacterium]|nr:hypothetical protein [Kiritimatiellia bacterium]